MKYKKILSIALVFIIFGFIFFNIYKNANDLSMVQWKITPSRLMLIILALLPVYFVNTLSWHLITKSLGLKINYSQNLRIWTLSNASRFIPGSIWQYAGRVYLASKYGVPASVTTTALFIEMIYSLFSGAILIALTWPLMHLGAKYNFFGSVLLLLVILIMAILILSNNKIITRISKLMKKISVFKGQITYSKFNHKFAPVILSSFMLQFILDSFVLYLMVGLVTNLTAANYLQILGVFSLSWMLGYLTFFSPSGLGVQELSVATLLSSLISFPIASLIAVLFRLGLIASEMFILILVLSRQSLKDQLKSID